MDTIRLHGSAPYRVVVAHGGPGAAGSAAPLCRGLACFAGVLEALQSADSVAGQVAELAEQIGRAAPPVTLIGHSWGAMLGLLTAAARPELVARLVMVASGPLEASYAAQITPRRLANLPEPERSELAALMGSFEQTADPDAALARLGELCGRADAYEPIPVDDTGCEVDGVLFQKIWSEAAALREAGGIIAAARELRCPVTVIHGDHDCHPGAGVIEPLRAAGATAELVLLERCGHEPWAERWAREPFFAALRGIAGGAGQ